MRILVLALLCDVFQSVGAGRDSEETGSWAVDTSAHFHRSGLGGAQSKKEWSALVEDAGGGLQSLGEAKVIERLGQEIAKSLVHELREGHSDDGAASKAETSRSALELEESELPDEPERHNGDATGWKLETSRSAVKPEEREPPEDTVEPAARYDGLLELAEQLVHKLRPEPRESHGHAATPWRHKAHQVRTSHQTAPTSNTAATGLLERSSQLQRSEERQPNDTMPGTPPRAAHKHTARRPVADKRMEAIAGELMQLKATVDMQKTARDFTHALEMFHTAKDDRPCIGFGDMDEKLHSTPVGSISKEEFLKISSKPEVFEKIDRDGSGKFDKAEYEQSCKEKTISGEDVDLSRLDKSGAVRSHGSILSLLAIVPLSVIA